MESISMQFLKVKKLEHDDTHMRITWNDGKVCSYDLLELRKDCPCANCRGGHGTHTTRTTDNIQTIRLLGWKTVGRYALQFTWSDGHDLGMYTMDNLRERCENQ